MNRVDWIALGVIAIAALSGLKRGLVATALSLGALALGAVIGSRLAPHVLHEGSRSPYTPLVALGGALVGALLFQTAAGFAGSFARGGLSVLPPLRMLDSIGGLIAGAALGLGAVWVVGAVLLQLPGETTLRRDVQQSTILKQHQRDRAAAGSVACVRAIRPLRAARRPGAADRPAGPARARLARGPAGATERRQDHGERVRARSRGVGLGRAARTSS